jgi:hypothetical protein
LSEVGEGRLGDGLLLVLLLQQALQHRSG